MVINRLSVHYGMIAEINTYNFRFRWNFIIDGAPGSDWRLDVFSRGPATSREGRASKNLEVDDQSRLLDRRQICDVAEVARTDHTSTEVLEVKSSVNNDRHPYRIPMDNLRNYRVSTGLHISWR